MYRFLLSIYLSLVALPVAAADKPNVIMILCDDVGFECFSAYGSREYSTPRLDALAAGGIRFENCHSTPLCTPSRVNLMSGKSNVFNYFDFGVYPKGEPTFGNYFKEQGYATAVAGKWQLLTKKGGISPKEAGFDTYCLWNFPGGGRQRYWNPSLVQNGDKNVGRLEDTLKELGLREKTLIISTGDNGTNSVLTSELHGRQIQGGKGYTHDYGTHVPLIVNWPGKVPSGKVIDDLVCFSDLFPTMVEAAGLAPKKITDGDGWSFWPQCQGKVGRKREWIYCYYFHRPLSAKYNDQYSHYEVRFARDKRYKLYDSGELFDTIEDVLEKRPIAIGQAGPRGEAARNMLQQAIDSYTDAGRNANRRKQSKNSKKKK